MDLSTSRAIESGRFSISRGPTRLGSETYEILPEADGYVLQGHVEMNVGGGTLSQDVRLVTNVSYAARQLHIDSVVKGNRRKIKATFAGTQARVESELEGTKKEEDIGVGPEVLVLSSNVFHHLIPLLRRYDMVKSGPQEFAIFPIGRATIEARGTALADVGGKTEQLDRYVVDVGGIVGVELLSLRGRLLRIAVPLQGVEVRLEEPISIDRGTEPQFASSRPAASPTEAQISAADIQFQSMPGVILAGELTLPVEVRGACPGVVLVSGSGPQDRNEDTVGPGGLHYGIFRTIATYLSARGFAVLRYDDRGVAQSTGDYQTATLADFVQDVHSAVRFLRSRPLIDPERIGIVGHSEGGIIAAMVASQDPNIRAIVMLGATAHPLDQILLRQFETLIARAVPESARADLIERRRKTLETIKTTRNWDSPDVEEQFRRRFPVGRRTWLHEHFALDVPGTLQQVRAAVAILHGALDCQADPSEAHVLEDALQVTCHPDHVLRVFSHLDHLFMPSQGRGLSEYADRTRTLDQEFLGFLSLWLTAKLLAGTAPPS